MARPTKRTPEIESIIVEGLRAGLTVTAAAARAKVDQTQVSRWRQRFAGFAAACADAEGEAEARFTATLAEAARPHDTVEVRRTVETVFRTKKTKHPDGTVVEEPVALKQESETTTTRREFDWRAAESWLKRRRREEWGDNVAAELSGPGGGPITITEVIVERPAPPAEE